MKKIQRTLFGLLVKLWLSNHLITLTVSDTVLIFFFRSFWSRDYRTTLNKGLPLDTQWHEKWLTISMYTTTHLPNICPQFLPAALAAWSWDGCSCCSLVLLGRLAFGPTFWIFKFRSCFISLHGKPQNSCRNGQSFKIFQIFRIFLVSDVFRIYQTFRIFLVSYFFWFSLSFIIFQIFRNFQNFRMI